MMPFIKERAKDNQETSKIHLPELRTLELQLIFYQLLNLSTKKKLVHLVFVHQEDTL
jgi:hypothetical protein